MKTPDEFIALATRGLFVFDWTDIHRSIREEWRKYELVAAAYTPITASGHPSDLQALAAAVRLENVSFATREAVDIRARFVCSEAAWFNVRS